MLWFVCCDYSTRLCNNKPHFWQAVAKSNFVLDIGSGTGLLSMFAARAGAKHITTVEGSDQMGDCAARCIAANGLGEAIHPLIMMSTDIVIGEHMQQKADLCISEIVDCGLLGEWCLPTMQHARENLLTEDAVCTSVLSLSSYLLC